MSLDSTTTYEINEGIKFYEYCYSLYEEMFGTRRNLLNDLSIFRNDEKVRNDYARRKSLEFFRKIGNINIEIKEKYLGVQKIIEMQEKISDEMKRFKEECKKYE